jgi:protein phosphatase
MDRFLFFGRTDQGRLRVKNEDSILVDQDAGFCLVADGIGGTAAGDIASQMFAHAAQKVFSAEHETEDRISQLIQKTFLMANDAILKHVKTHPGCEGMGCTAELLALCEDRFVLGHMGDSRVYRLRGGELKQLTKDHSLVQEQLEQGLITPEEASHHALKNVILRAVGIRKNPSLDVLRGNTFPGDLFLLCSDGLSDMISDPLIFKHLNSGSDIRDTVENLISEANANGGKDNISVVLARIL